MKKRCPRGFTLLEILVAMVIFSVVMTLIFGTFSGVFSGADHVTAGTSVFEMADACMGRITADLQSMYVMQLPRYKIPDMDSEPDIYRVQSKNETMGGNTFARLRFSSLAHLPISGDNREGIAEIVYYAEQVRDGADNDTYVLKRADILFPYPEKFEPKESDPVMCEQVREFKLTFYDKDGREQNEWDSEDNDYEYCTPSAVKIEMKLGNEASSYQFTTGVALPMRRIVEPKR
ncbi:MAG: prepilin-type N-terminal cleavage/methylation domain-containing protein [Desulfobacteraceae bacterium]|nr:prepilin-type N-terminal cleavage/methylation domain-containing protein [Desulfobacteraceae bacterium]